jgi:hypothetical protein
MAVWVTVIEIGTYSGTIPANCPSNDRGRHPDGKRFSG